MELLNRVSRLFKLARQAYCSGARLTTRPGWLFGLGDARGWHLGSQVELVAGDALLMAMASPA